MSTSVIMRYGLNNSKELITYTQKATTSSLAYTGLSFTLPVSAIVSVYLSYNDSEPKELVIADGTNQVTNRIAGVVSDSSTGLIPARLYLNAPLPAVTYYIWARSANNGSNGIGASVIY